MTLRMGKRPDLPAIEANGLADVVLGWAADGAISGAEIVRRLKDEYDLTISRSAVADWLGKQRDDRRLALAQAAASDPGLQQRLTAHLTSDLDMVDHVLQDIFTAYKVPRGVDAMVDLARALFDGLRTKAKLTGMDGPGSAVAAVVVAGGVAGRLRDLSDADLRRLLAVARESVSEEGGLPTDEGGAGLGDGRTGVPEAGGEATSTAGRGRVGAGDGNGSPRG